MTEPWVPDWIAEMKVATDATLLETLGEQQLATLVKHGAALDLGRDAAGSDADRVDRDLDEQPDRLRVPVAAL